MLSNSALNAHSFQFIHSKYEFKRGKSFLFILPPFLGFGISHIHAALNLGIKSHLWLDLNSDAIAKEFFRVKPDYFATGPAFIDAFLRLTPKHIPNLEAFVGGGGDLPEGTMKKLNDFLDHCKVGTKYASGYGLTETSSTVTGSTNVYYREGSVGIPMCKNVIKVVSLETGRELSYNEVGEIWVSTPNLMTGYYKNEQDTKEIIITDPSGIRWLKTGDLGMVDADGYVYIKGRLKRIYITKMEDGTALKLFPQKIESILNECKVIKECAVVVIADEKRINAPVFFVTVKDMTENEKKLIDDIKLFCESKLSVYEMPMEIRIIEKMPTTASGKIDYVALEEM